MALRLTPRRLCVLQNTLFSPLSRRFLRNLSGVNTSIRKLTTETAQATENTEFDDDSAIAQFEREYNKYHIPTSLLQKSVLAIGSTAMAFYNQYRHDMVAVSGETTGYFVIPRIKQRMMADPVGRQILAEKPRINSRTMNLDYMRSLPEGTFGRDYIDFMDKCRISPDTRMPVKFIDNIDDAYVIQRYREVHDFCHSLLGMPTNFKGEVVVKWYEWVQTGLPMCGFAATLAPIKLPMNERIDLTRDYISWVVKTALTTKFYMNVYFEKHFEQPLDEFRQELGIGTPPVLEL
ncbi:ubiquinone biosynthesis protein COQ4 homolog, mitochondrial-like [Glandiceps talaboti]